MAAQAAITWRPAGAVADPEDTVSACLDDEAHWSTGRMLAAAAVAGTAALLVATPAVVGLASIVDEQAMAGAPAWVHGIPGALTELATWRVPAAIVLVLGLAGLRRNR
jgi:hypothetical protein